MSLIKVIFRSKAYAVKKSTCDIYEIPFIGMSNEEAIFKNRTFSEFIEGLT